MTERAFSTANIVRKDARCYIDSFGGLIACRVLSVERVKVTGAPEPQRERGLEAPTSNHIVRVRVTAKEPRCYRRGEVVETSALHVVPRVAVYSSSGQNRIAGYSVQLD